MTFNDGQQAASAAPSSMAVDIANAPQAADGNGQPSSTPQYLSQHSLAGRYRRPSYIVPSLRPLVGMQPFETTEPLEQDREAAINEQRDLLEDNNLIPKRSGKQSEGLKSKQSIASSLASRAKKAQHDEETGERGNDADETTALLGSSAGNGGEEPSSPTPEDIDAKWEEAVLAGNIQTTWQREAKTIGKYAAPLMLTFILQNSLTFVSVFTVGHIDKESLGAVALGSMTASITGYSVYFGLATSLDTLCPQAYGSGKKKLVGLQLQRMVLFTYVCTIPIAIIWFFGGQILSHIVPEEKIATLAGQYLRILILGAPAYATFESAKRYVQAQGLFNAALYVLLITAPLNVFLHWLFVWHLGWGFVGCPIAVVITENLMVLLLFLYVRFTPAIECWPGFSRAALQNWGPMIRLALPGLAMILAEFLAFQILTLSASWIDSTSLGAQSILQQLSIQTYALPFPISIASSTRVANFIGAGLPDAAKTTARVTFVLGVIVGLINMLLLSTLRHKIPHIFTNDAEVIALAASVMPINAAFQLFDALAAQCNGILRGIGRQEAGGYICVVAYYLVAIPIALGTAFGAHLGIYGLWLGPFAGLGLAAIVEGIYIWRANWEKAAEEASYRNESN